MTPLPYACVGTKDYFLSWLEQFSEFVREVDYESARPLFHSNVLAFGTHRDIIASLDQWVSSQWDNVWPKTTDFRFDLDNTEILISADASMASIIAPWTSTGYHADGEAFDRPGRATMIFHRQPAQGPAETAKDAHENANWICIHSHMSLNRGVPQQSFADRPVKART